MRLIQLLPVLAALLIPVFGGISESRGQLDVMFTALTEGGPVGPDGERVACYLPPELRKKNTGGNDNPGPYFDNPRHVPGHGSGLCVFTSIQNAARFQNERRLWDLQEKMTHEAGGGYPEKVDAMIHKYGGPDVPYVQHTGGDLEFLKAAIRTGRMPGVTYAGEDMHYGMRRKIAHMVNLVYLDDKHACVLDNNFIGENQLVWMTTAEFKSRWLDKDGGWSVVLLMPPPPPTPCP